MRIDDESLIMTGNRNHDRLCANSIDKCMGLYLLDQSRCHRCIQADVNAHLFGLLRHQQYGIFHLALSGGFSGCHELSAELTGSFAQDRLVSALFEDDSCFQATDSTACDQYGLRFLCFDYCTLRFAAYRRVSEAGDMLHIRIGKTVIASLVASDAVDNVFGAPFSNRDRPAGRAP